MDKGVYIGLGVAIFFGLLPFGVKSIPIPVTWMGMAFGILILLWPLIPLDPMFNGPRLLIAIAILFAVAGVGWYYAIQNEATTPEHDRPFHEPTSESPNPPGDPTANLPRNVVNIPNALSMESLAPGIYLEGRRYNVLDKDCMDSIAAKNSNIAKLTPSSEIAPDAKQVTLQLEPQRIANLEFNGSPMLHRRDYTFSYIVFADDPSAKLDMLSSIESDTDADRLKFDFMGATPFQDIRAKNIKTFRPQLSHFFPEVPRFLRGKIAITNTTAKLVTVAIVLPVIEEGLFASSPINCGAKRAGDFLSYASKGNMPNDLDKGGTISFTFTPSWNADRLTPGIDPHFLSWTDANERNGINIFSDSKDHGKVKVATIVNSKTTTVASEITPLKGTTYSVDVRFSNQRVDLSINGNTWSGLNVALPNVSKLTDQQFYIGSNPSNEDRGAFSTMSDFRVYDTWLSDEQIKMARAGAMH